jgi:hypothetical protein
VADKEIMKKGEERKKEQLLKDVKGEPCKKGGMKTQSTDRGRFLKEIMNTEKLSFHLKVGFLGLKSRFFSLKKHLYTFSVNKKGAE